MKVLDIIIDCGIIVEIYPIYLYEEIGDTNVVIRIRKA